MPNNIKLSDLLVDEKYLIESMPLSRATKVGQIYCYISSGPIPMVKIGKGKSARQRMANWIQEYPPEWRNGEVIFVLDKLNQSTAETALHKFFGAQRISPELMREALGIAEWQKLPDGASEWFYCTTNLKNAFRSAGIDLVEIYKRCRGDLYVEPPIRYGKHIKRWLPAIVYAALIWFIVAKIGLIGFALGWFIIWAIYRYIRQYI